MRKLQFQWRATQNLDMLVTIKKEWATLVDIGKLENFSIIHKEGFSIIEFSDL